MNSSGQRIDADVGKSLRDQLVAGREQQRRAFARLQSLLDSAEASASDVDSARHAWEAAKADKWAAYDSLEAALKQSDPSYLTRADRRARRRSRR